MPNGLWRCRVDDPELGDIWFASIDGERWYEINRKPEIADESAIVELFDGEVQADGSTILFPMGFATRWFNLYHRDRYTIEQLI